MFLGDKNMKKILLILFVLFCTFSFVGCNSKTSEDIVRIHIRANSNSEEDQGIKLKVRDNIINYITPLIADCENSKEVQNVLKNNSRNIERIADNVLSENGYDYASNAGIKNEYFPSRSYSGKIFEAGYYDALIVNLGTGKGDNWWCVAYPPLCFVGNDNGTKNIEYKSKLVELINKFFGSK